MRSSDAELRQDLQLVLRNQGKLALAHHCLGSFPIDLFYVEEKYTLI